MIDEDASEDCDQGGIRTPRLDATWRSPQIPHSSFCPATDVGSQGPGSISTSDHAHSPLLGQRIWIVAMVPPSASHT